jgi:hypothetical protein
MAFIQDLSSGLRNLTLETTETNELFVLGSLQLKDFHKFDSAATGQYCRANMRTRSLEW